MAIAIPEIEVMLKISVKKVLDQVEETRNQNTEPVKIRLISDDQDPAPKPAKKLVRKSPPEPDQVHGPVQPTSMIDELNVRMASLKNARGKLSTSIFEMVYGHAKAPTIDIGSVLAHFANTVDEETNEVLTYDIMFLAINQRTGNVYVREMTARKNVKSPKREMNARDERGKQMYNLKFAGNMLLHDTAQDATRSVKVRMIFAFRKTDDSAWCRVGDRSGSYRGLTGPFEQVYNQQKLNDLYHQIDDYQPQIQDVFKKIRSLEETGELPPKEQPAAAQDLAKLKVRRKELNDLICKTKKKLQPNAKKASADKVIEWNLKLAQAEVEREEIKQKINALQ
jgi:hypothetical protein